MPEQRALGFCGSQSPLAGDALPPVAPMDIMPVTSKDKGLAACKHQQRRLMVRVSKGKHQSYNLFEYADETGHKMLEGLGTTR